MMKMVMSQAAAALLRALIARAGVERNRILLTDVYSVDWQSLTFTGERHHLSLRVTGRDSGAVVARMCKGLEEVEFSIVGLIVADIGIVGPAIQKPDGSTELMVEALTITAD